MGIMRAIARMKHILEDAAAGTCSRDLANEHREAGSCSSR